MHSLCQPARPGNGRPSHCAVTGYAGRARAGPPNPALAHAECNEIPGSGLEMHKFEGSGPEMHKFERSRCGNPRQARPAQGLGSKMARPGHGFGIKYRVNTRWFLSLHTCFKHSKIHCVFREQGPTCRRRSLAAAGPPIGVKVCGGRKCVRISGKGIFGSCGWAV
jgi:hypothetical protein